MDDKKEENGQISINLNKKYIKFGFIGVIFLIIVISGTMILGKDSKEEYNIKLKDISTQILGLGAECEQVINVYTKGWKLGINSKNSIERIDVSMATGIDYGDFIQNTTNPGKLTDKKEMPIAYDFNGVLKYLNEYYTNIGKYTKLKEAYNLIENNIKELKKPHKDLKEEYDIIIELATDLKALMNKAIYVDGSYNSYVKETSNIIQKILDNINILNLTTQN